MTTALHLTRRRLSTMAHATGSFIARAKAASSARALLGPFESVGVFDSCLEGMNVLSIGDGCVTCEMVVRNELCNNYGTLHGGAISTAVDVVGTLALLSKDPSRAGVSIEMNQTFCSAAKLGETIVLLGSTLRYGKTLGFTEVELRVPSEGVLDSSAGLLSERPVEAMRALRADGRLVATGRHTKMFV